MCTVEVAAELARLHHAVDRVLCQLSEPLGADDLRALTKGLQAATWRLEAATVAVTDQVDRSGAYTVDGALSAKAFARYHAQLSVVGARRHWQAVQALRVLPAFAQAWADGRIGADKVALVARLHANPRIRDELIACEPILLEDAVKHDVETFALVVRHFARLADADGATQRDDTSHARRSLTMVRNFDGGWTLSGRFGALQGQTIKEMLDRQADALWQQDLAEARARDGEDADPVQLQRSPTQRRADALEAICESAAATPPDHRRPEPLLNLIVDQHTFEQAIRDQDPNHRHPADHHSTHPGATDLFADAGTGGFGATVKAYGFSNTRPGEATPATRRYRDVICRAIDGEPVHPHHTVAAAALGRIRRIVADPTGRILDVGRSQRLFSAAAKEAMVLERLHCDFEVCFTEARRCEADHTIAWSAGGPSDYRLLSRQCGGHNRLKQQGFRVWRDPHGTWHTYRPDGTEIT